MQRVEVEARSGRSKAWTYLILALVLIAATVAINLVISNPEAAKQTMQRLFGLPGWALTAIVAVVGAVIFWLGLKVEADWPEHLGAILVAGASASAEILIGWRKFELGGLVVLPYVFPLLILAILWIVAMQRSR